MGFFPNNQFGQKYLSPKIKEYNILILRNELNTFNDDFSKELDKHYSEGELIDERNHATHPYAWAVDTQIQIFADYFKICVAVWQDNTAWNLFVPRGRNSIVKFFPEYEVNFNKCISDNIIYIYNANYGHYFLIEPKTRAPPYNELFPRGLPGPPVVAPPPSSDIFANYNIASQKKTGEEECDEYSEIPVVAPPSSSDIFANYNIAEQMRLEQEIESQRRAQQLANNEAYVNEFIKQEQIDKLNNEIAELKEMKKLDIISQPQKQQIQRQIDNKNKELSKLI